MRVYLDGWALTHFNRKFPLGTFPETIQRQLVIQSLWRTFRSWEHGYCGESLVFLAAQSARKLGIRLGSLESLGHLCGRLGWDQSGSLCYLTIIRMWSRLEKQLRNGSAFEIRLETLVPEVMAEERVRAWLLIRHCVRVSTTTTGVVLIWVSAWKVPLLLSSGRFLLELCLSSFLPVFILSSSLISPHLLMLRPSFRAYT